MTTEARLETIAPGVHAWIGAGGDSNAGAIETPDGVLVIDAQQYPRLGRMFRDSIGKVTSKPLEMLINTHCHMDHTHGNVVFDELPILAHDNCLAAMKAALGPLPGDRWNITDFSTKLRILFGTNVNELVPEGDPYRAWFHKRIGLPDYDTVTIVAPTQTFADQFVFHLPNETVRLEYWGPAHCDNDIVVHLEKSKIIFLSDLLFNGRYPWLGDGNLQGWIDRLSHVMTLDIAVAIPGHGPPTDLKEVARFRRMLIGIRDGVEKAIKAGWSEEAAVRDVQVPEFAHVSRYQEWMPIDVKAAYRQMRP
jgi:glyoxylase-like metal-dependent hydrolase (beta-lactamase superfamily II)